MGDGVAQDPRVQRHKKARAALGGEAARVGAGEEEEALDYEDGFECVSNPCLPRETDGPPPIA